MVEKQVIFRVDGLKLSGILHYPDGPPAALIVGVHGLMADKNSPKQIALARRTTAMKMAYFRFDHRGCGESEGDFNKQTTLINRESDLIAATQAAKSAFPTHLPMALFGSSLGGTVCLIAARQLDPFALVTLSAPVRSGSIQLPAASPDALKNEIEGNRLTFNITDRIQTIHHILVLHGSADEIVPIENAHIIFRRSTQPKKQIILENGDHRISDPAHQKRFVETTAGWFFECYRDRFGNNQLRSEKPV